MFCFVSRSNDIARYNVGIKRQRLLTSEATAQVGQDDKAPMPALGDHGTGHELL